ncbi:phage holin family protein [Arthrobacter roseus]|uniref:phage holin family protein n=1 Tax=Arthrobacter roseus TaxID=136274 RepID=UPI0019639FAD|nr:phage holin family protein [Arthrobacter roseus]MBM7848167.1 hypothetical protein [Arthrobacter roseus]
MSTSTRTRGNRETKRTSLLGLFKVMIRLTPRQVTDEVSLAMTQMKQKGIQAGVAVAFFVVALVFLGFLAVALIVSAIAGLSNVMDTWLAALAVGGLFLIILVISALIGLSKLKKALPLMPEDAIRGVRHDIGVLKDGKSFDESTLDREKPEKDKKKDKKKDKDGKPSSPAPSFGELKSRTRERREHIAAVRDGLGRELDPKARKAELKRSAESSVGNLKAHFTASGSGAHRSASEEGSSLRWKPLMVLAISVGAMVVMARKLLQK